MSPISSPAGADRTPPGVAAVLLPVLAYAIGAIEFFRGQIFSHFDLVFGDRGDTRLIAFVHEHVFRWLQGHSALLSPPFFFDQTKTLGYSDAFLLDQLIYAPLRLLGAEPLLALSLVAFILSVFSFFFFYLFLRRLDVSAPSAAFGAFLVTFANNLYLAAQASHLQLLTLYYMPLVAYCGLMAVRDVHRRPLRACFLGAVAAGLYGLLFSTGYYVAWFFGLGLLIFVPIAAAAAWPVLRNWWSEGPARVFVLVLTAAVSFAATMTIFIAIYAPVLALGFKRNFDEYLLFAPTPIDIVNVGMHNLVWSRLIRLLHLIPNDRLDLGEVCIALTPVVQCLAWASGILALRPRFWPTDDFGRIRRALAIAGASVCALFYLLSIKIGQFSLFHILFAVIPGADAIRDGYRGMVVANLFAATAIALTFSRIVTLLRQAPATQRRAIRLAGLAALLSFAAAEQINLARSTNLSRTSERQHMSAVGKPPPQCRAFYAAPQSGRPPYEVQNDAMMIALAQHLPTINGDSGLFPPGWDFYDTRSPDYEQRARRWAQRRGIAAGLCRVDVDTGRWTAVQGNRD